jgi:hypothetical protein
MLSVIAVIYLYSVKKYGEKVFPGDRNRPDSLWTKFIKWLQKSPADDRCASVPTISVPPENVPEPSVTCEDTSCYPDGIKPLQPDKDCIV